MKRLWLVAMLVACHREPPAMTLAQAGIDPAWMQPSTDPCNDFFTYACGGFVANTQIPQDQATWGPMEIAEEKNLGFLRSLLDEAAHAPTSDPVRKKLGDYYATCMDEASIEQQGTKPLEPLLTTVAKVTDFQSLVAALPVMHANGFDVVFSLGPVQDSQDATQVIADLDQAGITLPDRDYYLSGAPDMRAVRADYRAYVTDIFRLAAQPEPEVAADDVLRLETKLARLHQDKLVRRDPYAVYHPTKRAGLPPGFPWDAYLTSVGVPPSVDAFTLHDPAYYPAVVALMHGEPAKAWRHYLAWNVIGGSINELPERFVRTAFAFSQKLTGQAELEPRWKRCVGSTHVMGELLGQLYVQARFASEARSEATQLVEEIQKAMRAKLDALAWMDAPTRQAAQAKLDKLQRKVGYPDHFRAYDFPVGRASLAENMLAAVRAEVKRGLDKIGKPVDRQAWELPASTVNAFYDSAMNEILVPAGILQPPLFTPHAYPPAGFGSTGAGTVGHEITHAFDDEGSQFDAVGNLRDWWTPATKQRFADATRCVADLYSTFDALPGLKVDGKLTVGENIADIGGVKLGYAALGTWQARTPHDRVAGTSDAQLFFLAYAQGWCSKETPEILETMVHVDEHAPARWRVNGPLSQVPDFAKAFQCRAGAPLNPATRCAVW